MKKFEEYAARPGNINWEKLIERQSLIYSHEKRKRDKMNITAELERMQKAALKDDSLRKRLLSTKNEMNLLGIIKDHIMSSSMLPKFGAMLLKPVFKNLMVKFDYKEVGGAPFLGVDGICIKAHGSSDGKAFKNAIRQTKIFHEGKVIDKIKNELGQNN